LLGGVVGTEVTPKTNIGSVIVVLVLGAASGCASGPIPGRLIQPGQRPEVVTLNYESSVLGGSGKLWTVLPDGQRYRGKYVLVPRAPDHHMVSTLEGDRGSSMLCRFRLNEPGVGPHGGGTGTCELSQGGEIELTF
jgi:hypothetical protein